MAKPITCRNSTPIDKDELTGGTPTKGSGTPNPIPTAFKASTCACTYVPTPGPSGRYTDKDLQKATKLALKSFV